jgi:hypothetical protein
LVSFAGFDPVRVFMDPEGPKPMNATTEHDRHALALAEIIEFKWLLAGEGVRVHVERLQADPDYAHACLARAEASPRETVRRAAGRLRQRLGLD